MYISYIFDSKYMVNGGWLWRISRGIGANHERAKYIINEY